jgi:hypothetical protein
MSDVLGVSTIVDNFTNEKIAGGTESTVLGPFYIEAPEVRPFGAMIARAEEPGDKAIVSGAVNDERGRPVSGAVVDVWQAGNNGLYDVNDPSRPKGDLRARFTTGQAVIFCAQQGGTRIARRISITGSPRPATRRSSRSSSRTTASIWTATRSSG